MLLWFSVFMYYYYFHAFMFYVLRSHAFIFSCVHFQFCMFPLLKSLCCSFYVSMCSMFSCLHIFVLFCHFVILWVKAFMILRFHAFSGSELLSFMLTCFYVVDMLMFHVGYAFMVQRFHGLCFTLCGVLCLYVFGVLRFHVSCCCV